MARTRKLHGVKMGKAPGLNAIVLWFRLDRAERENIVDEGLIIYESMTTREDTPPDGSGSDPLVAP
jgi:hypothetical protein